MYYKGHLLGDKIILHRSNFIKDWMLTYVFPDFVNAHKTKKVKQIFLSKLQLKAVPINAKAAILGKVV